MSNGILCALDISNEGSEEHVLIEAIRQAKQRDTHLDVITVLPDFGYSMVSTFFDADQHKSVEADAKNRLNALVTPHTDDKKSPVARTIVATGSIYEQVLKTADKVNCDLIVIGANRPELRDYLLGPNSARIVRHSSCSVFVVRG